MMRHFGRLTGVPYPWNKYAQVVVSDFIFGGMENTTATTMYEHILLDERAALDITSDDLIAHELAHQWFGDLVTCRDWSHAWLNEGFATFMEHVDREHHLGATSTNTASRATWMPTWARRTGATTARRLPGLRGADRHLRSPPLREGRASCSTSCAASSATRRSGGA
jgi:predicted aminopeptidase